MTDTYQAIYDAVRSKINNGNVGDVVRDVAYQALDISHARDCAVQEISVAAANIADAMTRPSVLYRPTRMADGTMWMVLYGPDLAVGVAGFGETPDAAMKAFDDAWKNERTPAAIRAAPPVQEGEDQP